MLIILCSLRTSNKGRSLFILRTCADLPRPFIMFTLSMMECGPMHAKVHQRIRDQRISCRIVFLFPPFGFWDLNSGCRGLHSKHLCPLLCSGGAFFHIVLMIGTLNLCVQTLWLRGPDIGLSHGSE